MEEQSVKRKVLWTIDNVTREKLEQPDFELFTHPFTMILGDNVTKWKLHMAVNNENDEETSYLSVCPRKLSVNRDDFYMNTVLRYGDEQLDEVSEKRSFDYDADKSRLWLDSTTIDNLLSNYVDEDESLEFEIEIELSYPDGYRKNIKKRRKNDYTNFFKDEKLSDFILKSSDGNAFKVHRLVLADCSEFFEKMVTTDMQERNNGAASLVNVSSEVLEDVLRYVYTGNIEIVDSKKATAILDAAEEFGICGLKALCVEELKDDLKTKNVTEMLKTADLYNAKDLEIECMEIIVDNYDKIKETKQFESLENHLLIKIMDALANTRETININTEL